MRYYINAKIITPDEIIREYNKNKQFYSKGGITVTGGEPLLQIDFVTELFRQAKAEGIHTCIDTSGITYNPENAIYTEKLDELMEYTDLVMLDIKHISEKKHTELTGGSNKNVLAFAQYLEEKNIPVWIRHVVVEGYTDSEDDLIKLGEFIGRLKNLKALDVLPFHNLAEPKYEELGIPYKLKGMKSLSGERAEKAKSLILKGIKNTR